MSGPLSAPTVPASSRSPGRAGGPRNAGDGAEELQLGEQVDDLAPVVPPELAGVEVELDGHVPDDGRQPLALDGVVAVVAQGLPQPGLRNAVERVVDALDAAVLVDQAYGGLAAHAGDAGDVVGRVALQRLDVGQHLWTESSVPFHDSGLVVDGALLGAGAHEHTHPGRDELEGVGVAGEDQRLDLFPFGLAAQRSQDVVGLVSRHLVGGDSEDGYELPNPSELAAQLGRSGRPVRLVVGELQVAEGRLGEIEGDGAVGRLPVGEGA